MNDIRLRAVALIDIAWRGTTEPLMLFPYTAEYYAPGFFDLFYFKCRRF